MRRINAVFETLKRLCNNAFIKNGELIGFSAIEISKTLNIQRTNASSDLNKLCKEGKIEKATGKPVLYRVKNKDIDKSVNASRFSNDAFDEIIGANLSLKNASQQAKAAIIYPPNGLHTLLLGETGTGKSMFAETMYKYAKEIGKLKANAPFVAFNCADYANNPQLLMSHIFGVKKGTYTGAIKDRIGLMEKANEGILFLDEVHRLPAEGQEMLFYLIDKGVYRSLGEVDEEHAVKVLIICATTENIESVLLKTFTRRIPMIIRLPALRNRSIEERYEIIKNFFKVEASCIKQDIRITANALKALLLYKCSNNIGQLKSDIKLCCSKAFLENMMKRDEKICIHSQDLPQYVLAGLFEYKEKRNEVDKLVNCDLIKFSIDESNTIEDDNFRMGDFYEVLEEKREILQSKGISEEDIKLIISLDIDTYFKKYIDNVNKGNLQELYKVVDKKTVDIVSEFLKCAGGKLSTEFDVKILYGLSMHVASSIERISNKKEIKNHQLEEIKKLYREEFKIAYDLKTKLEEEFKISIPEDEVGFITMFLCMHKANMESKGTVGVVVAMHGESAATSIAEVANRLLGQTHAVGYNMSLDEKPEVALGNLTTIVEKLNRGKGVLLLVDMGSLVLFGDMIYEKTKISVKTIEMVSTPIVLEATRKALLNLSLEEIFESCINIGPYAERVYRDNFTVNGSIKRNIIITACITGEGTAIKLKNILEKKLGKMNVSIDIINIDITNTASFKNKIQKLKSEKNVLAIVSAVKPEDESLLYISTSDIFDTEKDLLLKSRLSMIETIYDMKEVIRENVSIDSDLYIDSFRQFYISLLGYNIELDRTITIGLILHIACALEHILNGEILKDNENNIKLLNEHKERYSFIKSRLQHMEEAFSIKIAEAEYANILKIVYSL